MNKIGIIVAMDKELSQLRAVMGEVRSEKHHSNEFFIGRWGNTDLVVMQCGIGKVNAAIGAVEMIEVYHPEVIISSGVAGGADVSLNPLDVVVATSCAYHDVYCGTEVAYGQVIGMPARFEMDKALVDHALRVRHPEEGAKIVSGLTVTGDWFVDSREKMADILDKFPAAKAVDMESCAIAQVCHRHQIPFVSYRIISDVPMKDHQASQYYDFWAHVADGSFEVTKSFLESVINHSNK